MIQTVVDSSLVLKWFLDEPFSAEAALLLERQDAFHAPSLLLVEVTNVLARRVRAALVSADHAREVRATLARMPLQIHETRSLLDNAFELSIRTRQSAFDCVFLALSLRLSGSLVTADYRFYRGVQLTDFRDRVAWIGNLD